jgi:hypothetical protein
MHGNMKHLDRDLDLESALDWTVRTIELLKQLRSPLSKTSRAWSKFASLDGDISYFLDMHEEQSTAHSSLLSIKESFEELEDLQQTTAHLTESCRKSLKIVRPYAALSLRRLTRFTA